MITPNDPDFSIEKQCDLLGIARSTYYYTPCSESAFNLAAMREMDKLYTAHPEYGKRRMSVMLKRMGLDVGVDLARTLMEKMGLVAIGPKPNLSRPHPSHKIYPYRLRGVPIVCPNQIWSTDITYVPMKNSFLYLTAIIDWYSRYILSWRLSNSLDGQFCRDVLREALERFGKPEWFNTDQGAQYTCLEFVKILEDAQVQISMDGRGRALDNVWMERLWRTVKYEDIYAKNYEDGRVAHEGIGRYFVYYNTVRPHSALGYMTPEQIYQGLSKKFCMNGVSLR